ncbi:hypothetical protein ACFLTX_00080 [Chloroflexota bacterium]
MAVRSTVFFDDELYSHLKTMADSEMRSISNFLQVLVKQEWDQRNSFPSFPEQKPQAEGSSSIPQF